MFIIQMSEDEPFWLEGWNGSCQELDWTPEKKNAWKMERELAERMLRVVKEVLPDAILIEV